MNHQLRRFAVVVAAMLLGGCFFRRDTSDCRSVEEYQASVAVNPVVVPSTLSAPDESAKLVIPKEPLPAQPLADTAACLAKPPDYFRKTGSTDANEKGTAAPLPAPSPATKSPTAPTPPAPGH